MSSQGSRMQQRVQATLPSALHSPQVSQILLRHLCPVFGTVSMEVCSSRMSSCLWIGMSTGWLVSVSMLLRYIFRSVPDFHVINLVPRRSSVVILVHLVGSSCSSFSNILLKSAQFVANLAPFRNVSLASAMKQRLRLLISLCSEQFPTSTQPQTTSARN